MKSQRPLKEEGSVLVLTVLVSMVLLGMGLSAMWAATSGTRVAGNMTRRLEALTAAHAGLERARQIAAAQMDWTPMLGTANGGNCKATRDDPTGYGNILCATATAGPLEDVRILEPGSTSAAKAGTMATVSYTVYVRNDPTETAAGDKYKDSDRRIIARSVGVSRDGISTVSLETVLSVGPKNPEETPGYAQVGGGASGSSSAETAIGDP